MSYGEPARQDDDGRRRDDAATILPTPLALRAPPASPCMTLISTLKRLQEGIGAFYARLAIVNDGWLMSDICHVYATPRRRMGILPNTSPPQ